MMEPAKDSLDLGILVSDIKSSLNFYQNILGLKFIEERPLWFGTMHRLRFGSSDFKLIDPHHSTANRTHWVRKSNRLSLRHVCHQEPFKTL